MKVIACGPCARFTDHGRVGHQHKGFTQSGALDSNSHNLANAILGKALNSPTIEILFGGFIAVASEDIFVTVTGAQTAIKVANTLQSINTPFVVLKGQKIEIGLPTMGLRNYIACHKNYDVPYFLDSCCMVARENNKLIKQNGIGLQAQDNVKYLQLEESAVTNNIDASNEYTVDLAQDLAPMLYTELANEYIIRVVPGYQQALFDHKIKALFFNQRFVVSADTNTMGMRLEGQSLGNKSVKMYSEGIANGAIQITPNGLPIIMLCERQTIGGYPKIGSVISTDLPELGQCRPGTYLRFEECDMLTARQLWLLRQHRMKNFAAKRASANNVSFYK